MGGRKYQVVGLAGQVRALNGNEIVEPCRDDADLGVDARRQLIDEAMVVVGQVGDRRRLRLTGTTWSTDCRASSHGV